MTAPPADPRRDTLIDYPCAFPIKVMGARQDGFVHAMTELARQHDPGFDAATVELRESSGGKYLSVTIEVYLETREQINALYAAFNAAPEIKLVY